MCSIKKKTIMHRYGQTSTYSHSNALLNKVYMKKTRDNSF